MAVNKGKFRRKGRPAQEGARMHRDLGKCPECGKTIYETRRKALQDNSYRAARPGATVKMRAYQCGDYWHLTSMPAATVAAWKDYRNGPGR